MQLEFRKSVAVIRVWLIIKFYFLILFLLCMKYISELRHEKKHTEAE